MSVLLCPLTISTVTLGLHLNGEVMPEVQSLPVILVLPGLFEKENCREDSQE